ncbi:MAG: SDR family oxidoreductase [Thermodesulfobacteriota bacterium]
MSKPKQVFITGGAGYVGAVLVPKLLARGHRVKVLDLYIYGEDVLDAVKGHPHLTQIKGDLRDRGLLNREIRGFDTVLHLACISNDPSFELNPELGRSINYDAFLDLVATAARAGVKNFLYASSSSVYGIKDEPEVTEDLPLEPLTDYSKYKALCEQVLLEAASDNFVATIIRPSTVCGYSPRQRLDLTINILTNHAVNKGEITVFGGEQQRPNLHIEDMTDLYVYLLDLPDDKIRNKIWNVGYQNLKVREIAEIVQRVIDPKLPIKTVPTDDIRSYHVSSRRIAGDIGFVARHTVEEAVLDLKRAFAQGKIPNPLEEVRYYNIRMMQALNLH